MRTAIQCLICLGIGFTLLASAAFITDPLLQAICYFSGGFILLLPMTNLYCSPKRSDESWERDFQQRLAEGRMRREQRGE